MKTTIGSQRMMFPMPAALVVTGNMEKANIVTIAWVSMLTGTPPTLGIAVGSKGFSGEDIKKNGNFSVNLASVDFMKEADLCGIVSGKDVDKFAVTGFTKMTSKKIASPIIKECPINIECKLIEARMTGATNHFVGEILETHIDSDKIKDPNNPKHFDVMAVNPLIYFSGIREYYSIGKKAGDAYKTGKDLMD